MVHTERLNVLLVAELALQIPCPAGTDWLRLDITYRNLTASTVLLRAWYVPQNKYNYANRLMYNYSLPGGSNLQLNNLLIGPNDLFETYPHMSPGLPGIAASCIITYITPD